MATNNEETFRDAEFEAAFGVTAESGDGEPTGGLNLEEAAEAAPTDGAAAAETAGTPSGEPAAVVTTPEPTEVDPAAQAEAAAASAQGSAEASGDQVQTGIDESAAASAAPAGDQVSQEAPQGDMPAGGEEEEPTDPKEIQRKKSWEGRLRAEEKRLKDLAAQLEAKAGGTADAGQSATGDAIEQAADQLQAQGDQGGADSMDAVAEQLKSGEITPEEAMKILADDFGPEFVKMIEVVARASAGGAVKEVGEKIGRLEQETQDVISHLQDSADRAHYQAIYDAHPDFMEVTKDPQFDAFVAAQGKQAVVEGGSAKQINKLLSEFKESTAKPAEPEVAAPTPAQNAVEAAEAQVDQGEVDAAEGVRSAGMRVPEQPSKAADDDYEAAWSEF